VVLDTLKGRGISLHMIDLGGDVTGNGISKLVFTILSQAGARQGRADGDRPHGQAARARLLAARHFDRGGTV
jgi:hypothetical protein